MAKYVAKSRSNRPKKTFDASVLTKEVVDKKGKLLGIAGDYFIEKPDNKGYIVKKGYFDNMYEEAKDADNK